MPPLLPPTPQCTLSAGPQGVTLVACFYRKAPQKGKGEERLREEKKWEDRQREVEGGRKKYVCAHTHVEE